MLEYVELSRRMCLHKCCSACNTGYMWLLSKQAPLWVTDHAALSEQGWEERFHVDYWSYTGYTGCASSDSFETSAPKSCWLWPSKGDSWGLPSSSHILKALTQEMINDRTRASSSVEPDAKACTYWVSGNWNVSPSALECKRITARLIKNAVLFRSFWWILSYGSGLSLTSIQGWIWIRLSCGPIWNNNHLDLPYSEYGPWTIKGSITWKVWEIQNLSPTIGWLNENLNFHSSLRSSPLNNHILVIWWSPLIVMVGLSKSLLNRIFQRCPYTNY